MPSGQSCSASEAAIALAVVLPVLVQQDSGDSRRTQCQAMPPSATNTVEGGGSPGAVHSAVVISGCLALVSRLRQVGQPWNPLAFPPGVAGLVLRGAVQFVHVRVDQ